MRCASCGSTNPEGARFCIECAALLGRRCQGCGVGNLPQAKFCAQCGASLVVQPKVDGRPREVEGKADTRREGERRQLTVMFCDVVGSTALSERLDLEEWRAVVRSYHAACATVIRRFEGHVAQYLGDGLLVYFGYPQAHEDDAQRAVRAGLEIISMLETSSASPALVAGRSERGPECGLVGNVPAIQVRIGVHTGLVVVGEIGDGGKGELLALGETPNLAARLQGLAEPNTVVISAATHRLITGLFHYRNLGLHSLKGLSAPVQIYQVEGESSARSRLEAGSAVGLTPLVGREEEVAFLQRRWGQVTEGEGQVVLLGGEPGIGKSRLVQVLTERLAGEAHLRIEWRCSPYHQNSAFYPVIEQLRRLLHLERDDGPENRLRKLEGMLEQRGFTLPEVVPLFAALLSLPLPERYPPLTVEPERLKQRTLETLVAWLRREAQRQPALLIVEDLHWVDPSTLELLGLLIEQLAEERLFPLLTFRPDFRPPWPMLSHLTQLTLSRLARRQVEEMVESIAGGKGLPAEVVQQVIAKTDGVPLFVEELTKAVLESGVPVGARGASALRSPDAAPSPPLAIPTTLHDSLMARLDRLATAKEVAQLGATLGREFGYELIEAVSPVDAASLRQALAKLVDAELLYQRGQPPQARYVFKHALIQDAAYQSLLKSTRQRYHERIARTMEERLPETIETQPELLAHHYSEAGLVEQALPYWQDAGRRAVQRSANVEAISHLTRGLELLKTLPDSPEHARRELALQIALGVPLRAIKGFAAPEVGKAYARALELCRREGETSQLVPVLRGLWEFHELRAEYGTARELGEQLVALAGRMQDPGALLVANDVMGDTLFWLGEFAAARSHLEQGVALYDVQQHQSHVFLYGYDSGVACLGFGAWALWFLGYPDQALRRAEEALSVARQLAHPFSLAFALQFAAQLHHYRREYRLARELATEVITVSAEQGFPLWSGMGTIIRGWALAKEGKGIEGLAQIRQGIVEWQVTGFELEWPHFLALLAEAHETVDQPKEGLKLLAEARAAADKTGEGFWDAEMRRLHGELSLQVAAMETGNGEERRVVPEESFLKAIEIARRQQAKSLELRAVMSLSRLWQRQGKKDEARRMLTAIYGWFTEGRDTPDLREAKALREELS
jgi:TOMM system kinase/cyclase fusion protein